MPEYRKRPLVNYHTHTWRCMHAEADEEEYVRRAIAAGFEMLGFADHTPWPYESGFVSHMRMPMSALGGYLETVRNLAEKYTGRIRIPLGLECEAFPQYMGWLADLRAQFLDYLILGNHYDGRDDADHRTFSEGGGFYFGRCTQPAHVRRYAERTIAGMRTGLFDCVAHPDLFCHQYSHFDADCTAAAGDICAAARALDLPLEYNLLGVQYHMLDAGLEMMGYPCEKFWEIAARHGCKAIIGFDAHCPEDLEQQALYDRGLAFLEGLGMEVLVYLDKPGLR